MLPKASTILFILFPGHILNAMFPHHKPLGRVLGLVAVAGLLVAPVSAHAQLSAEFEAGAAFTSRNDVRIPNATGTAFSFVRDLPSDPVLALRGRLTLALGVRHEVSFLAAPLTVRATGTVNRPIQFEGVTFEAGAPLDGTYTFNSYRLTYRYRLVRGARFGLGVGVTAKIRDARVALANTAASSEKTDFGFVPLLNLDLVWRAAGPLALRIQGDALAAPQGRAEDVLVALEVGLGRHLAAYGGYRLLEGGADVPSVYSFAWFNYLVVGVRLAS